MKHFVLALCFLAFTPSVFASKRVDLPPDATGEDYQHFLNLMKPADAHFDANDGLDDIVAAGTRNLQWLTRINASLPEDKRLSFTGPTHRPGYPINKPRTYSPPLILDQYQDFLKQAPQEFLETVTGGKDLPSTPPSSISIDDYLTWGRNLDVIYQISTRWRLMAPDLVELAQLSASDVRGYFFLSQDPAHEDKLSHFVTLSDSDKAQLTDWLVQMCRNATDYAADKCATELTQLVSTENGSALKYYNNYLQAAKVHYDSYFQIPDGVARKDLTWAHDKPELTIIPFMDPMSDALRKFMLNVEDEWHWGDWHLRLNFVSAGDVAHLEFQPGVTPHVNEVGGNIITMDQNTPLSDWENNWTIRHEFGHVLGFLDCYVEFYDEPNKVMTAYQLDVTNLMCSRQGNLKEIHYDELKRVYYK